MYFLGLGILLLVLKWQEIGWVASWEWWWVLSPFALAVVWWSWCDWSGYSKKKEMEKMERRKQERIEKNRAALRDPLNRRH